MAECIARAAPPGGAELLLAAAERRQLTQPSHGVAYPWLPREGYSASLKYHLESVSAPYSFGLGGAQRDDEQPTGGRPHGMKRTYAIVR